MIRVLFALAISVGLPSMADANVVVTGYNLSGAAGSQASNTATIVAPNVTGLNLIRGPGLTGAAGANSMNASGWTGEVGDYFSFGFTVDSGFFAELTNLEIGTRSSGTGPGTIGLFASTNNFTTAIATISQAPGGNFVNSAIDLTSLGQLTGTVEFRLAMVGTTSANGGTVGSGGTFRVTNYFVNAVDQGSFRFNGTISAVPEPTSMALVGCFIAGAAGLRFRRKLG